MAYSSLAAGAPLLAASLPRRSSSFISPSSPWISCAPRFLCSAAHSRSRISCSRKDAVAARFIRGSDEDLDVVPAGGQPVITANLVAGLLWKERLRLFVSFVALLGCSSCTLTMPIFSGAFFETLIGRRSQPLWKVLRMLALVYVLEPVLTVVFVTNMIAAWENVMAKLRSQLFRRLLVQRIEFYDRHKVGELTSLLSTDLGSIKDIINENISRDRGFRALSETLGTLVILFFLSRELAPILGLLMLSISVSVAVYKRTTLPVFKAHGEAQSRIMNTGNETFSAIRTVRSFGGERRQMSLFERQVLAYKESGNRLGWLKSANESWTRIAIYISLMTLYILGGMKVQSGDLAVGKMVSFIGYTFTLTFAVQGLVNTLADMRNMLASVDHVNSVVSKSGADDLLARGLGDLKRPSEGVCKLAWSGDVVLEDVHFSYPMRPDVAVLRGISLRLKQGTVTALVGSSGAGKSTIVQLLARFYEPSKGRITLAQKDVRLFDKTEWASAVSIVNQEPVLFAVSVAENIAYGLPNDDVPEEQIVAAAKAANAHEFIVKLPQGYETLVGERGSLLSGGQRQRIAIARALLKNSPLLILDEATSALDSVSEKLVQDALNRLMKGRTTLVIAHRLSTVQAADQIAVCSNGSIVELGKHAELQARSGGMYANLVQSQRLIFE
ncbi:ABC transporter B family member 28 [Selaginella moellendorffii]|uniref:ABC transporter B family member 28 n=1 Tax=Selaginella moellendorffii TaxID=88036 RepID=UPI000D1C9166|nr:ABC transporter B family member 28 [Selaginella moellendorffii]|eukprot:XP_024532879.1 ABC transporter B family member 28 [Selaginella moellendorffii]